MKQYSENRAAQMLGVSRGTLRKESDQGNISYHIRNGKRRFAKEDIDEYKKRQFVPARTAISRTSHDALKLSAGL